MQNETPECRIGDSESQIAVVGRAEVIAPFRAAGLAVFPVEPGPAASDKVQELADAGYGVVFYTEDLFDCLGPTVTRCSRNSTPCLVMLPMGTQQQGVARLREIVKRAVGADIFGRDQVRE